MPLHSILLDETDETDFFLLAKVRHIFLLDKVNKFDWLR